MALASKNKDKPLNEPENVIPETFYHERFQWFAVLTQSGNERKAKLTLEERIKKLNLSDFFGHILIPTMIVERIDAQGKRKKVEQRMMPGYLFVQMDPENKSTFGCVKETPKISKFVVPQIHQDPQPVPFEEMERLFNRAAEASKSGAAKTVVVAFEKGEKVRVIDGPFTNFIGDVDEVKADKMKLRLLVSVFGRPTPVELEFSKVEKIKESD
jgi:transcriptional antiterminator NusG